MRARFVSLALAALLSACAVGPHYHEPKAGFVPPAYGETHPAGDPAAGNLARWWSALNDPVLTDLINRGLSQNLDLAAAASRVREARLTIRENRAGLFPTVDGTAQAERLRISKNGGFGQIAQAFSGGSGGSGSGGSSGGGSGGAGSVGAPGSLLNLFSVGVDASWQVDIFGGQARQVQSARRRAEAEEWSRRDTAVTIAAEIADDYYQLRVLQRRYRIAVEELQREDRTLAIIRARGFVGLTPNSDVTRQLVQIASARASLGPIEADARATIHALGILIGETPESLLHAFDLTQGQTVDLAVPPDVPVGLPSDLLRRRPDVRQAERNLAAATSDIGVAVADLYPKFTISAPFSFLSTAVGNLFTGNSINATASGGINFPLLDFGRRTAVVGERREQREQAYVSYQQAVLKGLQETEDALERVRIERQRRAVLAEGVRNARASVDAISVQYRFGLTDLTSVLNAQQDLLQAEDNLAQSEGTISRQTVALYKALGGGWESLPAIGPRPNRADMNPEQTRAGR